MEKIELEVADVDMPGQLDMCVGLSGQLDMCSNLKTI